MGHREDLLAGAKECLYDKGFGRTTARDIVAASKTNLASIGYHFGSKEALLTEALVQATAEWGEELERALTVDPDPADGPMERFERTWTRVIDLYATHHRLWSIAVEGIAQVGRIPEMRKVLAEAQDIAREELALTFHTSGDDDERTRVLGAVYQALLTGVMVQWLVDPGTAPSGRDLAQALRMIAGAGELRG
ncbi:TetR/AcrR family transcriptional regulator [Pseudonocardia bannensis]|uniref:TetR/AcrR family transcriptional regulator n=1 Tax=Pseudonocardia bannensis TaxID=630973 RepID=A0A848DDH5_9PSEU|nr:TetR/AcrR family transcriptional regulator [Pseudonocardia bannensis]NMH90651.1 TetR/AcrR family transcriptional regulator [Pseudonocardia bannensis]